MAGSFMADDVQLVSERMGQGRGSGNQHDLAWAALSVLSYSYGPVIGGQRTELMLNIFGRAPRTASSGIEMDARVIRTSLVVVALIAR
jgi:hypothetical protein